MLAEGPGCKGRAAPGREGRTRPGGAVAAGPAGRPRSLLAQAERGGFDLLVVGRRGRDRLLHGGGLGRVAREVVEQARCPVLVVGDQGSS